MLLKESEFVKIVVSVPKIVAEKVRKALGKAGAGKQGNYDFCSASYPVKGRFRPLKGAKPLIGTVGRLATVDEEVIETICDKKMLKKVIIALKKAHPYEEPAIDIIPRFELK